jgi:hypothetical protein
MLRSSSGYRTQASPVRRVLRFVPLLAILATLVSFQATSAQSPTDECAEVGLEYVDKIDSVNGSGNYVSDEGFAYSVTVTDQPNPTPDTYTLAPSPASSGYYPEFTNITELPKHGVGGGLSHITICGDPDEPDPTPTIPVEPTVTPTVPVDPTVTPTIPDATATPTEPGTTVTPTVPGSTVPPAKTPVSVLPNTGASPSSDGQGELLLIAGAAVFFASAAWIATRTHGQGHRRG